MGKSSKTKGATGERELCKILADAFSASFVRSPGSGAFVGGRNAIRKSTLSAGQIQGRKGDIVTPDHMPRLVIEAKNYAEFRFHQLLTASGSILLDSWIAQVETTCDPGDEWLVLFKITRVGWFACARAHADYKFGRNYVSYGQYRLCALDEFLSINRDAILRRSR